MKAFEYATKFVLKEVQRDIFGREICCLQEKRPIPKDSSIISLNPSWTQMEPYMLEVGLIKLLT